MLGGIFVANDAGLCCVEFTAAKPKLLADNFNRSSCKEGLDGEEQNEKLCSCFGGLKMMFDDWVSL